MQINNYITATLVFVASFCTVMLAVPREVVHSQSKDSSRPTLPPLPRIVVDTLPTPAIIDRIAGKTEELKSSNKIIRGNSDANLKRTIRLGKIVDKLQDQQGATEVVVIRDTVKVESKDSAKRERPGRWFRSLFHLN